MNAPSPKTSSSPNVVGKRRRSLLRRLLTWVLLAGILFVGVSCFFAFQLTGPFRRDVGVAPADFPFAIEAVSWQTEDQHAIKGWLVTADDKNRALVLLHGYGEDRRAMLPRAKRFRDAGYNVLLYDARACGESSGDFTTFGYHEANDLIAGLELLRQRGFRNIACLGVSQGAATILLAADRLGDVRCVVCESVYDELAHAVDNRFRLAFRLPGWLCGCVIVPVAEWRTGVSVDAIKPIDWISRLSCPVFLMSGEKDELARPEEASRLFAAAKEPKQFWVVPDAGHQHLFSEPYADKVLTFLGRHMIQ